MGRNWSLRLALVLAALALVALLAPRSWIESMGGDRAPVPAGTAPSVVDPISSSDDSIDPASLVLTDLDGERVDLAAALADGPVILDFWATWCAPCKIAMPAYDALQEKYAEHGVELWAVSWDRGPAVDRIAPYFQEKGFDFPALLDPGQEAGRALGVSSLPTTFLIDTDGSIVWRHVGFAQGDERELERVLRETLDIGSGR